MGRRKIEMKVIAELPRLKVTYLKRHRGLIKKAAEVATLCNIDVAVIMFSPAGKPVIYASDGRIDEIIARYTNLPPVEKSNLKNEIDDGKQFTAARVVRMHELKEMLTRDDFITKSTSLSDLDSMRDDLEKALRKVQERTKEMQAIDELALTLPHNELQMRSTSQNQNAMHMDQTSQNQNAPSTSQDRNAMYMGQTSQNQNAPSTSQNQNAPSASQDRNAMHMGQTSQNQNAPSTSQDRNAMHMGQTSQNQNAMQVPQNETGKGQERFSPLQNGKRPQIDFGSVGTNLQLIPWMQMLQNEEPLQNSHQERTSQLHNATQMGRHPLPSGLPLYNRSADGGLFPNPLAEMRSAASPFMPSSSQMGGTDSNTTSQYAYGSTGEGQIPSQYPHQPNYYWKNT